ncbi:MULTISPECIES: hypothetical protein [Paenibacillaceae]|uniref:Uncharacterized protein n=1 Tax=Paenibacillus macerans TaxID=44252 RepID=A0A090ZA97_PAEMA|nr:MULTISPECIES: hypothetical protein [Paenibacillaceae]UUZ83183.1 hypothetical protein LJK88_04410 [Paenibacillus sp. P26]UUZ90685.1 hypothetical protein LJK87_33105 [Paenibacillus sp. P25]KFN08194.1 hypothetical protein DJ90_1712 [Paenibacillus macerans]MCY7557624.1 hypothetical protein [Paenibacillus macerans]MEC0152309.1 hypothetical protein [Paenibacillus macerans]
MMYFTKGRRRQYERLMQEKPGFNRFEVLEDEIEQPRTRNKNSRNVGLSKQNRGTRNDSNFPGNEDGQWKK